MQLKLTVYTGKKPKTYTTDTIDCSFGVIEDVIAELDFEKINDKKQLTAMVLKASKQLRPFLKDIFHGISDEEIRSAKMSDIVNIFKNIYTYAIEELDGVSSNNSKN